jgi:hypothetical protein
MNTALEYSTRVVLEGGRRCKKSTLNDLVNLTPLSTKYVHIKSTTVYAPRRNWDSPQPPTRRLVCPLPPVSGGRGTLAGEKGVGRVPIPTKGIHCGTLYMYVLCASKNTFNEPARYVVWK